MSAVLVVLGAIIGAPLRYLTDRAVQVRHDSVFPWGTFIVNVAGSCLLGFVYAGVAAHGLPSTVMAFVGTGFCGTLTTYSTFSFETLRLWQNGSRFYALTNVLASIIAGLGSAFVGAAIAQAIWH